jgi:acyl-CoA oxidase
MCTVHQHFRLLSLLAKTYAMYFASQACDAQYSQLREMQAQAPADHSLLPSVHTLTAGLKAYVTSEATDGAEDCRKLCGGHGYMVISGLPDIIGAVAGGRTFEGENYVLWQQTARYLLKQLDRLQDGGDVDAQTQYLTATKDPNEPCIASGKQFLDPDVQLVIYRDRAHRLVLTAHTAIRASSMTPAEAWNEHMILLISASRAHIEYFFTKSFVDTISSLPDNMSPALRTVLSQLGCLFALSTIINPRSVDTLSFLETNGTQPPYLSSSQLDTIRSLVNDLLAQLLPEAIALTDTWDFSDASLCSVLSMYDGNVYENIMRWVEQMPINKKAWENGGAEEGWAKWVDPILKNSRLEKAKL